MRGSFFRKKGKPIVFAVSILSILTAGIVVTGLLSGSNSKGLAHESTYEGHNSGFVIAEPGSYDSVDTAVVKEIDTENSQITFMNIETGRYYTLAYDGTTMIQDKHGSSMAMSQMQDGDIVDVAFLRGKKTLTDMKISDSAWTYEDIEKYNFDTLGKSAEVGSGVYSLRNNMVVSSEGEEAQLEDIIKGDVVSVSGVGNSVYSVVVEEGHGYLRLSSDEYLKGGWIEVGQSVIQEITEDMLLAVPEGTHEVHLTASGIDEVKEVTIGRNQEVTLDVSDVQPAAPKTGKILFAITPADAVVYIDGTEVDISVPVELEYGVHQMIVKAEGYETVSEYIKVGEEMATISLTLEKSEDDSKDKDDDYDYNDRDNDRDNSIKDKDKDKKDDNTLIDIPKTPESASSYKIYVQSPKSVQVYFDGVYKGIAPVSFKKQPGKHTITLRKTGYVTKSYTVQIDNAKKDVTYSFTDLVKDKSGTVSGNKPDKPDDKDDSVSDNSVSDNSVSKNSR